MATLTPEQQEAQDALDRAIAEEGRNAARMDAAHTKIKGALLNIAPFQKELQEADNEYHQSRNDYIISTNAQAEAQAAVDALASE